MDEIKHLSTTQKATMVSIFYMWKLGCLLILILVDIDIPDG